ncbi:MAG: hypothetical protein H3C31_09915 [Brumimicrobium sp.]|nr:hypothetical protein [Brumimicrobium sp.]
MRFCIFWCFLLFGVSVNQLCSQRLSFRDSVPSLIQCNYFAPRIGIGSMTLRDENLSPLFYDGFNLNLGFGYEWYKPKWYHDVVVLLDYGALSAKLPKTYMPTGNTMTHVIGINLSTTHLWRTPWIPSDKWTFEIGGSFKSSPYGKINPSLFNNAFSASYFLNIMSSGKISYDLSRTNSYFKTTKKGKEKLKTAVQRKLNFQFDAGLLNLSYLPGFTNVYMTEYGDDMKMVKGMFKEYKATLKGFRFDFKLEFLHLFSTGNGHRLALVTSVLHTPGRYRPLDFGATFLQYTMLINQKK